MQRVRPRATTDAHPAASLLVTHRATSYIRYLVERTIGAVDPQGSYPSTVDGATSIELGTG